MRRIGPAALFVSLALVASGSDTRKPATSWAADNGNGTYSNPLFYDEFSDPDLIRVGSDYYLTGTTMHTMPGLPILHSRDMVNWRIIAYAFDRLDLSAAVSTCTRAESSTRHRANGGASPCRTVTRS